MKNLNLELNAVLKNLYRENGEIIVLLDLILFIKFNMKNVMFLFNGQADKKKKYKKKQTKNTEILKISAVI